MKIIIPVNEKESSTDVCISFGRAPYFLIHDSETQENQFIDNTAADASGGAGIKAAQLIVDHKAEIVVTPRCGENAAEVLVAADITIYKSINALALDNIEAFKAGRLLKLNEMHKGLHGHGGK